MKKFTLLAGIALLAGSGAFAEEAEEIYGLKISTDTQKYYYRISNMRAQRMSYIDGKIYYGEGYDEDDETGFTDNLQVPLPEYLPDGETPTPEIYTRPYMGLSNLNGNWWCAFSAQDEVVDVRTTYWYFTAGTKKNTVVIHNAVMDGSMKRASTYVTDVAGSSRAAMGFDLDGENNYYVIEAMNGPISSSGEYVGSGIVDQDWYDYIDESLTSEQQNSAYAFSVNASYSVGSSTCLDMNNYISYTWKEQGIDPETGELAVDENDEPVYSYYGFAGVDRTWTPINVSNEWNHIYNNGSLFFVERDDTTDAAAAAAIEGYQEVIAQGFRDGAIEGAKAYFTDAVSTMKGWLNVPGLWKDQTSLQAIVDYCENWNGEGLDISAVNSLATRLEYEEAAEKLANAKLIEAVKLAGNGAVVTLQNQLAYRDLEDSEGTDAEEYVICNAYITAGGFGTVVYNSDQWECEYPAVIPTAEATENSQWTMEYVWGTTSFLLYNEATGMYIRQYKDMYDLAGGDEEFGGEDGLYDYSWATTTNKEEAAPFTFVGCPDAEAQTEPTDDELMILEDYEVDTDITNNVRLTSSYTVTTPAEEEGEEDTVTTYTTNIHRSSLSSFYTFVNYTPTKYWWYADTNAFKVGVIKEGGISEVAAENNTTNAVYDLQGRRVAKAGKGIYIINGVKTLVR